MQEAFWEREAPRQPGDGLNGFSLGLTLGLAITPTSTSSVCRSTRLCRPLRSVAINTARFSAASCRDLRAIVPHKVDGLRHKDSSLSSMAHNCGTRLSARCRTLIGQQRYRAPRSRRQRQHITRPSNSLNTRASRPQHGATKKLQLPPLGNRRVFRPTDCATSPSRTTNSFISGETSPSARRRGIRTSGKSSITTRGTNTCIN